MSETNPERSEQSEFSLSGTELVDYLNGWADTLNGEQDELTARIKMRPEFFFTEDYRAEKREIAGRIKMLKRMQQDLSERSIRDDMERNIGNLLDGDTPQ